MGFPLLRDQAEDLEFPDRYAAVRSIEMRVHPFTGLQFEDVGIAVQRPDSGERCESQVLDQKARAIRKDFRKGVISGQRNGDVRHQHGEAHALGQGGF